MDVMPPAERLAGRYALRERIASGGMASVWRGEDEVLARTVAVKLLDPALARDDEFLKRFRQEAVSAAGLNHPRIIRIYDTGTDGDHCFIVMELFEGEDLGAILARGPLPPDRAAWIVSSALDGLAHAHERGVIHRDVKPGNVLVGRDGDVKVADFGVAKAAAGLDLTETGRVLGTARYLSPEQVLGEPADARSDVYAAGLVLYEALTGRPPFDAETDVAAATLRLHEDPMPPRALRAGISRDLERVVLRALERDRDARFADADEMRRALGNAMGDATGEVPRVAAPPPSTARAASAAPAPGPPSFFRSWMLAPLVLLLLTAAAIVIGLLVGRLELGGPLGVRPAQDPEAVVLRPARATDVDPEGDGRENPDEVRLAIDGDAATAWTTERYNSPALGGLKSGVGLAVELPPGSRVTRVEIRSPTGGWTFQIRGGGSVEQAVQASARAARNGRTSFTARDGTTAISFESFRAPVVVVWITGLAPTPGGFQAALAEVVVRGERG